MTPIEESAPGFVRLVDGITRRRIVKDAIRRYVDKHPGSDEMDIADALNLGFEESLELCQELADEGKIAPLR